ncbi:MULTISPECIES: hypothetical protein [unclassified Bartonella]|uniref:hypothetical protein n=1 Tax=unclassified Bartonella TaxID=2645622 RepID=UPI00235FD87F|nr:MULTISPECIES: hypothetical protein [unclassified Bartonella]
MKSEEKTRDYYFRFAKRSLFLLLRLVGLSYFAAAATLIIILVLTLPLTVCIAPIQDRIQLLPNLFLLHVLILWIQFCEIISMETVAYIACFEMFVYILCSFFHAVFIAELLEQQSHLLKQNNR